MWIPSDLLSDMVLHFAGDVKLITSRSSLDALLNKERTRCPLFGICHWISENVVIFVMVSGFPTDTLTAQTAQLSL